MEPQLTQKKRNRLPKKEPPLPDARPAGTRCLHLALPDARQFFTEAENLLVLIEFARTFRAEVSLVELEEPSQVHDLDTLVAMLCAGTPTAPLPNHKLVEVKIKGDLASLQQRGRRERAAEVTSYARSALAERGRCSSAELQAKFPDLAKAVLSNILNRTVQRLRRENFDVVREAAGVYRLVPPAQKPAIAS